MPRKFLYFISSFLLLSFLAGGVAFGSPAQANEVEGESEICLRAPSFSQVLVKKVRVVEPITPDLAKQPIFYAVESTSFSAQIAFAIKGNSLYLLNSSLLI